jgi:hypothetical protein
MLKRVRRVFPDDLGRHTVYPITSLFDPSTASVVTSR